LDHTSGGENRKNLFDGRGDPLRSAARIGGMNGLALACCDADPSQSGRGAWRPAVTDERLIHAIATHGDRAAFAALFMQFAPRVKTYLMRRGSDGAVAEELAQEVLLIVWRRAAQFDASRASAAAWIFTIARNLRIDAARRTQFSQRAPDPTDEPAEVPAADAILAAEDRGVRVGKALAALPAEQAEVIRMAFFDDRPHADIERVLGIPLGTVKSRLRLAILRLRKLLEDDL
jgi:RNA polymerase sigma-70 factor (ECF subfamily)